MLCHTVWVSSLIYSVVRFCSACTHGSVELVEGRSQYEGRVAVCMNGAWSSICRDTFWGHPDARVICRQLGYLETDLRGNELSHQYSGSYSPGTGSIISELECSTAELNVLECNFKHGTSDCTHTTDVGVQCMEGAHPTNLSYFVVDSGLRLNWKSPSSPYMNADMLEGYTAFCTGQKSSEHTTMKHTSSYTTSNTTREVTFTGLQVTEYNYSCCVVANYKTYPPKVCLDVSINTEVVVTNMKMDTESPNMQTSSHQLLPPLTSSSLLSPTSSSSHQLLPPLISSSLLPTAPTTMPVTDHLSVPVYCTESADAVPAIIGGAVVAGLVSLAALLMLSGLSVYCLLCRKRKRKSQKLENEVSGGQQAAIYDVIDNVVSDKDNRRQGIVPRSESDLELKENLSYASLSVMNIQPYSVISIGQHHGQHQSLIEMK